MKERPTPPYSVLPPDVSTGFSNEVTLIEGERFQRISLADEIPGYSVLSESERLAVEEALPISHLTTHILEAGETYDLPGDTTNSVYMDLRVFSQTSQGKPLAMFIQEAIDSIEHIVPKESIAYSIKNRTLYLLPIKVNRNV